MNMKLYMAYSMYESTCTNFDFLFCFCLKKAVSETAEAPSGGTQGQTPEGVVQVLLLPRQDHSPACLHRAN